MAQTDEGVLGVRRGAEVDRLVQVDAEVSNDGPPFTIVEKPPAETFLTKAALGPLSVAVTVCEPWLKPLNDTLSACVGRRFEAASRPATPLTKGGRRSKATDGTALMQGGNGRPTACKCPASPLSRCIRRSGTRECRP